MSTILNALKKLEQEQEHSDLRTAHMRRSFQRTVRFGWFRQIGYRVLVISMGVVLVGMGLMLIYQLFFSQKHAAPTESRPSSGKPSAQLSSEAAPIQSKVSVPENSLLDGKTESSAVPSAPDTAKPTDTRTSKDHQPIPKQETMIPGETGTPVPLETVSDEPAVAVEKTTSDRGTPRDAQPSERTATVKPQTNADGASTEGRRIHDGIPRLMDGRLKVQAIAWASDAQDRIAVINTHIVREGHTVEGFSVVTIEEDAIVVREEGQSYRVPFGRP